MDEKIEEVRRDIAATRARISGTLSELDSRVDTVKHAVTHTANPFPAVREHPWLALGVAISAGIALGMSGADRKAASAVKTGAKKAASGAKDAAGSLKERFSGGDGDGDRDVGTARGAVAGNRLVGYGDEFGAVPAEEPRRSSTAKVLDAIRDTIESRLADLTEAMLDASKELTGRKPSGI